MRSDGARELVRGWRLSERTLRIDASAILRTRADRIATAGILGAAGRRSIEGHFGEWMQGRLGPDGPVVLVTLPAPGFGADVWLRPAERAFALHAPGLSVARARAFLSDLGLELRGRAILRPRVAPGLGTGGSTALLIGLARLAGFSGPPEQLARACVAAEGASDPLMFSQPERLLWASRLGRVLGRVPAVPRYEILGGFCGTGERTRAEDLDFDDISDLLARWRVARDLTDFAALASESAARCSARRGPANEAAPALAAGLGALGWVRAHTGAARGLIFAPGTVPSGADEALRGAGWRGLRRFAGGGSTV